MLNIGICMGKKADEIIRRDHKVFLNTTMIDYNFVLKGGEGDFVYDVDGQEDNRLHELHRRLQPRDKLQRRP